MSIWFYIFLAFWIIGAIMVMVIDAKENDWKWFYGIKASKGLKNKIVTIIVDLIVMCFSWISIIVFVLNDYSIGNSDIF